MSYILDALRRADAERERDPGRGIHAQPVPLPAESARRFPWWIAALAVMLVVLVAVALLLRPAPRIALDLGMPPPNAPVARPAPVAPAMASVAAEVSPPAPPPLPVRQRAPDRPVVKAPPAAPARAAPSAPVAAAPAAAAPVVAAPAPAVDRVLAVSELPPEVQHELPKLQVSGGVHSDNPAQRMLIVGGQVVTEGAEAAPGVLVEQIRPKSAVLKFRGYRFSVQY
jgi:general secretion pathway protein B